MTTRLTRLFSDGALVVDLAPQLTCTEVEELAGLIEDDGDLVLAAEWRDVHSDSDEPGDIHYRGDDLDRF